MSDELVECKKKTDSKTKLRDNYELINPELN